MQVKQIPATHVTLMLRLGARLLRANSFISNRIGSLMSRLRLFLSGAQFGRRFYVHGKRPYIDNHGSLTLGYRVVIRADTIPVSLRTSAKGHISLGDRVFLNNGVEVHSEIGIEVGPHTRVGPLCVIADTNSHAVDQSSEIKRARVKIGRNVWLGRSVIVTAGSSIGDNSVISAGSIVTTQIPANQLWRGAPARYVREITADDTFIRS